MQVLFELDDTFFYFARQRSNLCASDGINMKIIIDFGKLQLSMAL